MKKVVKNKWLWLSILVGAVVFFTVYQLWFIVDATVSIYRVETGAVETYIEDTAEVVSAFSQVHYAPITAKVLEQRAEVGDRVVSGQILLILDTEDLKYQLEALLAQKRGYQAQVDALLNPQNKDVLAKLSTVSKSAKIALDDLKKQWQNQQLLYESGAASAESVNRLKTQVSLAEKQYQASLKDVAIANKTESHYTIAATRSNIDRVVAQICAIENKIDKAQVKATTQGIVVALPFKKGDTVFQSSVIAEVDNDDDIMLDSMLLAENIKQLKTGALVEVLEDSDVLATGSVTKIYPKAESQMSDLGVVQRRVRVKMSVAEQAALKLGYEYDVKIVISAKQGLRVPDSAVFKLDDDHFVFLVVDRRLQLKNVTVLLEGTNYYLLDGLSENDQVVKSPASSLKAGVKVEVKEE